MDDSVTLARRDIRDVVVSRHNGGVRLDDRDGLSVDVSETPFRRISWRMTTVSRPASSARTSSWPRTRHAA